jgi:hypothetical protein
MDDLMLTGFEELNAHEQMAISGGYCCLLFAVACCCCFLWLV